MLYLITGVLFNGSEQSHEDNPILDQDSYDGAGTSMMSPGELRQVYSIINYIHVLTEQMQLMMRL